MLTKKEQQILDALDPFAKNNNVEIVTVEVVGSSKSPVIRIYIDTDNGVSFKELTDSQEWIADVIDSLDPFPGAYTMEVSSPGIDRPLRTPNHFKKFINQDVKLRTNEPIDGSSNFKGAITDATDEKITISVDGTDFIIPFTNIKRANLIGKIDF